LSSRGRFVVASSYCDAGSLGWCYCG
jgi:hypothetical protein